MRRKTVSGIMLSLLLIGMLILAFNIQPVKSDWTWTETIYIRADGSIEPDTAPISSVDNITYTLTDNIVGDVPQHTSVIVVEKDNIVVDGAGYTLQGTGAWRSRGISLSGRNNVTIKNMEIKAFYYGIAPYSSNYCSLSGNNITNNQYGIYLYHSSNNTLRNNDASDNKYNFGVYGSLLSHYIQDIDDSNTVDGKPVYYWVNRQDTTVPLDAGYVALINCTRIIVRNLNLTNNGQGILLASTTNSTITTNNITENDEYGIWLRWSSDYNIVSGNNMANNDYGIKLDYSSNNTISGNNITDNDLIGIHVSWWSNGSTFTGNTISENYVGIALELSKDHILYHNNFINNMWYQVWPVGLLCNAWDNGYPSGGNYWSDYTGVDVKSGPNQDQPSSDGIGDTKYIINVNNTDHYPLAYPWGSSPPPSYTLTIHSSPSGVTFTVDDVSRATPWSGTYSEGSSVSLVMPETHDGYVWSHWLEDGDPNRVKTITMNTDILLTAVYEPAPKPVGGKATPINIPMNKSETSALWIWLTTIILSLAVTAVYVKKRKRNTRTLP